MSRLQKTIKTKATAIEMKSFVNTKVLTNSTILSLLESHTWNGDSLFLTSKFGKGTIDLVDYQITIDIELNMFGSMAKNTLESALDDQFKQLKS